MEGGSSGRESPAAADRSGLLSVKEETDELGGNTSVGGGGGDNGASGRVLKNSKRAAQNRAAQQAFRKRKEERIRELEDKERQLQSLQGRADELRRREQELVEREQLFALRQIKAESIAAAAAAATASTNGHGPGGHGSSSTSSPGSSSLFPYSAPQSGHSEFLPLPGHQQRQDQDRAAAAAAAAAAQAEQDARLEDAHKMLLDAQADYNDLKRQLDERDGLVAALRRSLEDMGSENRQLRAAAGLQSPGLSRGPGPGGATSHLRATSAAGADA